MTTYRVDVARGGEGSWLLVMPGLPGAVSEVHGLDDVEPYARDLIALLTDTDPAVYALDVRIDVPAQAAA